MRGFDMDEFMRRTNIVSARYRRPPGHPLELIDVIAQTDRAKTIYTEVDNDVEGGMLVYRQLGGTISPYVPEAVTELDVNREYDRRLGNGMTYAGNTYPSDIETRQFLEQMQALSLASIIEDPLGAKGLRWLDDHSDFVFYDVNNTPVPMTARALQQFAFSFFAYKNALVNAAKTLIAMNPIPMDFANDSYWPTSNLS